MDVTLWGSQPSPRAVYEFDVNVITEVVDNINVVLPLYRLFVFVLGRVYLECGYLYSSFFCRDKLFLGAFDPDSGVAQLYRERLVRRQFVVEFERFYLTDMIIEDKSHWKN